MRFPLRFLPLAVLGMILLASCNTTTFEVPKIGSRFEDTKKLLEYDTSLNTYVIPLEKYKTLDYEHFDITIPEDDIVEYYAPALSNSSNHAELFVRNLPAQTDFFGRAIYAQNQEGWQGLADIQKFYKEKYTPDKYTISLETRITKHDGYSCVEYDIVARLPETGKLMAVHGYCMFDPKNPGYIFDVGAGRTAYEKDIDDDFLIRASGLFFESVKFHN
ncbi:MAG: hypothetical protein IKC53_05595 [Lentisphaeria bacterium]|nr:hypothetical protein [Lentisphaeria bacterium]MBR3689446.1 hypothetical protein [Lentisphaeria bacterium]